MMKSKTLYQCHVVDADAVPVNLGGACPCGEGRIDMIDWRNWTCRHSGSAPGPARTHRLPPRIVEVRTDVIYRSKP